MNKADIKRYWKAYRIEIIIGFIGFLFIHSFLLNRAFYGLTMDSKNASDYGSFLNGYVGTLVGLISVLLLVHTLRSQIKNTLISRFENKYFQMINIHRDNASEFKLGQITGKKVFVKMIREYRLIAVLISPFLDDHSSLINKDKLGLCYLCFFYGIGPNSSRHLAAVLKQTNLLADNSINEIVRVMQSAYDLEKELPEEKRQFTFMPYGGHQSRLGHYFRACTSQ
jgi:hypothetical protein